MNHLSCPAPDKSTDGTSGFITFDSVAKTYPGTRHRALDGVTLAIPKGVIFGLLGPNGAGKTTLLSMLVGRITADAGSVTVGGRDITRESLVKIGMSPQEPAIYPSLTARENLEYFGRMQGLTGKHLKQRVQVCLDLAEIGDMADRRAEQFSGGYKRRLNLVIALIHEPELLILDETTVAIDPHSRSLIHQRLRELHAKGVTIVLSTHYMEEAEQLCHQVAIMNHGRVVTQGAVETLLASQHSPTPCAPCSSASRASARSALPVAASGYRQRIRNAWSAPSWMPCAQRASRRNHSVSAQAASSRCSLA
jgi:ABC-2 type transport system ATP-binding protein